MVRKNHFIVLLLYFMFLFICSSYLRALFFGCINWLLTLVCTCDLTLLYSYLCFQIFTSHTRRVFPFKNIEVLFCGYYCYFLLLSSLLMNSCSLEELYLLHTLIFFVIILLFPHKSGIRA